MTARETKRSAKVFVEECEAALQSPYATTQTNEFSGALEKVVFVATMPWPSGKLLSWSNITPCRRCKGMGLVKPTPKERQKHFVAQAIQEKLVACPFCDGYGSREVLEDELWWQYVEEYAAKKGFTVETSEADPCDVVVIQALEDKGAQS